MGVLVRKRHLAASAALSVTIAALIQSPAFAVGSTPGVPTNLATFPTPTTVAGVAQPCGSGTAFTGLENVAGEYAVSLSATVNAGSDVAPNYSAEFDVTDNTAGTALAPIDSAGQVSSGTSVSVWLPVTDGHSYTWTVKDTDGSSWSAAAGPCSFVSDLSSPLNPTVTSTDFPAQGGGLLSGQPGSFSLSASDPQPAVGVGSGLRGYSYSFDTPLGVGEPVIAPDSDGSLKITGKSFGWGTHVLYAQAVDNAGNVSGQTQYSFYVAQDPELSPKLSLSATGPLSVAANGQASTGLYTITKCTFDFGDQTPPVDSAGCTAPHTYAAPGTYPVTLTITDQANNQKSVTSSYTTAAMAAGTLLHEVLTGASGASGWAVPAGSTGLAQADITAMPDGSAQFVGVTASGQLEHDIRFANGSWQGWRVLTQPAVTVKDASIAGMPNGSSQIIEVLSNGTVLHDIRNANGSWQSAGWANPGGTGIVQAAVTALPDGSTQFVAVTAGGQVEHNVRLATGAWQGWRVLSQPGVTVTNASIAGMPNGSSQLIEVTSTGTLKHDIRNANGSWQGWAVPAGSAGIARADITALPNGSSRLVTVTASGLVRETTRNANGSWTPAGWATLAQAANVAQAGDAAAAGFGNGTVQAIEISAL